MVEGVRYRLLTMAVLASLWVVPARAQEQQPTDSVARFAALEGGVPLPPSSTGRLPAELVPVPPELVAAEPPASGSSVGIKGNRTTADEGDTNATTDTAVPERSAEETAREKRLALLREGDRHFQAGNFTLAQTYYQKAKADTGLPPPRLTPPAVLEISQLPPAAQIYWREVQAGSQVYSAQLAPLRLLVEQFPEFIPGHIKLAEFLFQQGAFREAQARLEQAISLYPEQPELQRALVTSYDRQKRWLEAALAARRFALMNPDHPATPEFEQLAAERMQRFRRQVKGQLRESMIVGALTGLVGVAVTGNPLLSLNSIQMMVLMMRGEAAIGASAARQITRQAKLLQDEEVQAYVNDVGQKLARVAGRNEFKYEFFVIDDNRLNAFALPGGKIFINAGAILKANTEAELAGLLAHEIAHTVLSHGFRLATQGTATANLTRLLPAGDYITGLLVTSYSREMEREADILGTRILARAGYAADGLLNLMHTLQKEYRNQEPPLPWFATHPPTSERIRYIRGLIREQHYSTFAFEGVERHQRIQMHLGNIMAPAKPKRHQQQTAADSTRVLAPAQ